MAAAAKKAKRRFHLNLKDKQLYDSKKYVVSHLAALSLYMNPIDKVYIDDYVSCL